MHDEKDKDFELEISWICPASNYEVRIAMSLAISDFNWTKWTSLTSKPYEPLVRICINCMCFWYLEITGRKMSVEFQRTAPCASMPKCRWSKGRLRKQRPNVSWKPNKRLGHWPGIVRDRGVESSCLGAMSIDSINLLLYRRENTHTNTLETENSFLIYLFSRVCLMNA